MIQNGFDKVTRVGEVNSVSGRMVKILVDDNKNDSHLLYKGTLIKNVSVGSYVKIAKGFVRIIAKVEGEYISIDKDISDDYKSAKDVIRRYLEVKLLGYIDSNTYFLGIKEMPLIGNECFLLLEDEFQLIHQFSSKKDDSIKIGTLLMDDEQEIRIGVNDLFGSHIGIFGNTGSGKSYTLAKLYHQLFSFGHKRKDFTKNAKFILFDFNGEYSTEEAITPNKTVYKLSTRTTSGQKLPFSKIDFVKPELISILANATEKTQQPFIKRALSFYAKTMDQDDSLSHIKKLIGNLVCKTLRLEDSSKGNTLLSYLEQIFYIGSSIAPDTISKSFKSIEFHSKDHYYYEQLSNERKYFDGNNSDTNIQNTNVYQLIKDFDFKCNILSQIITFLYLELSYDLLANRVNNEHVAPAINKLKSHKSGFDRIFQITNNDTIFDERTNLVVIDMNDVSTDLKKLVPLLLSQKLYTEHKQTQIRNQSSLHIIIDEAHNILSHESVRESETWKDYRLETFEEIIKEGRKFGVFLTIASQRPSDISHTIISQLHNFFIHRLVNQRDIDMVGNNVSYLDRLSMEQLPNLPTGGCVVAGVMTQLPVLVQIERLDKSSAPHSATIDLIKSWGNTIDENNS